MDLKNVYKNCLLARGTLFTKMCTNLEIILIDKVIRERIKAEENVLERTRNKSWESFGHVLRVGGER